jgi:hypothetical protein
MRKIVTGAGRVTGKGRGREREMGIGAGVWWYIYPDI